MCEITKENFIIEDSQSLDEINNNDRLSRHEIGIRNTECEMKSVLSGLNQLVANLKSTNDNREKDELFDNYMNRSIYKFISLRKNIDTYNVNINCEEFKDKISSIVNKLNNLITKDKMHYLEITLKQFKFYN